MITQIKPKLRTKVLQILQGQFKGFHFLISFLNSKGESLFLMSVGISSQILGHK